MSLIFFVVLPFCFWMVIRSLLQVELLPTHEGSQNRDDNSEPEDRDSKFMYLLRFLFCLPRKNNQQTCKSSSSSGNSFRTVTATIKRFVVNVIKKIFNGLGKIVSSLGFGGFSFGHSKGKFSEPIVKVMPSPSDNAETPRDEPSNYENDSTHSGMWIGHPRLVLASCLRDSGSDLYGAYSDRSFNDYYDEIASDLIEKLSRKGIFLVGSKDQDASPTDRKPNQTIPKDSK